MKYESKCPECGNVDILNEYETKKTVHCQRCYRHYDFTEERNCCVCKFYDGSCCMYDCACKAILNERITAKKCEQFIKGKYDEYELEKSNYR